MSLNRKSRPSDWPKNGREYRLDCIWDKIGSFEQNPSYKTRELLLAFVNDHDLNQVASIGHVRFTDYEVDMINSIYMRASQLQINSVKVYLYNLITEATRLQKIQSWACHITSDKKSEDAYTIKPYEEGLLLPLKLYHFAYQKYTVLKNATFAEQLLSVVNEIFSVSQARRK